MKLWNRLLACVMLHLTDVDRSGGEKMDQLPADKDLLIADDDTCHHSILLIPLLCTYHRSVISRMITIMKTLEMAVMFSVLVSFGGGGGGWAVQRIWGWSCLSARRTSS
jgi:hypothetical protein